MTEADREFLIGYMDAAARDPAQPERAASYGSVAAQLRADGERIKALEAALRPFAKAGELFKDTAPTEFDQRIYAPAAGNEWAISGDDLRRARDVLNAARERQGDQ